MSDEAHPLSEKPQEAKPACELSGGSVLENWAYNLIRMQVLLRSRFQPPSTPKSMSLGIVKLIPPAILRD